VRALRRYWFTFEKFPAPTVLNLGCGVTAYDLEDAMNLMRDRIFKGTVPTVIDSKEDIDVSKLDRKHILPNMGSTVERGVWFPMGYEVSNV
jgi:hypothetical protein